MSFWKKLGQAALGATGAGFGPSVMPPAGAVPDGEGPNKYVRAAIGGAAGYAAGSQPGGGAQQQGEETRSLSPATRALSNSQTAEAGGSVFQNSQDQSTSMVPQKISPVASYAGAAASGARNSGTGYAAIPGAVAGVVGNYMRRRQDPGQMPQDLENAGQDPYQESLKRATMYQRG